MVQPFIANLVFGISCEGIFTDQYEEQLRLVFAEDEPAAIKTAKQLANEVTCDFTDRVGRTIGWKFIAVKDIVPVELHNGSLIHSSIKETEPIGMI